MIDWVLLGKLIYDTALACAFLVTLKLGGRDERIGIAIVIVGGGATALNLPVSGALHIHGRYGLFLIDLGALIAFDALMVRSRRLWPICATGVQLAAVSLDLAKILFRTLNSHLFVQGKFAYLLLLVIVLGSICGARHRRAAADIQS